MNKHKSVHDFLLSAIKGLSKEDFDEAVLIFQKCYLKYEECINVDGANDGGCDIKIFHNKREVKKCVQVTVNKTIENKLKKDLEKVDDFISKYQYSNQFEFYCSTAISEEQIEEYQKFARDKYGIELNIYEAKRLSQLNCKELKDYIYSLHSDVVLKREDVNLDKATKALYDLLAHGRKTSDIKNSLLHSVIISILYEKSPIDIFSLKKELEKRLGKNVPDIQQAVNLLKTDQRVVKDSINPELLCLSDEESESVKDIIASSTKLEKDFISEFSKILGKYGIKFNEKILDDLKQMYKSAYSNDIDESVNDDEIKENIVFNRFKDSLLNLISSKGDIELLINEIGQLCNENSYLNKISASESFLSLYRSNQLERYLNQGYKKIYMDTPAFVYLLCSTFGIDDNDWKNPFYRSMKSLVKFQESNPKGIKFYIMFDYLGEVAGEIQKALQIANLEKYPFFKELGETSNTLYNYYVFLKDNELFDKKMESFEDFIEEFGIENTIPNDPQYLKDAIRILREIAEDLNIEIINRQQSEKFIEIRDNYEKQLYLKKKNKSKLAIDNDVNQVLYLLNNTDCYDCYLTTWDTTLIMLRDRLLRDEPKYNYFNIQNPAKLSNKIALENFNIDNSALTNDIFAYADKKYDISNKVKSLLELIAPIMENKNSKNRNKLLKCLADIRKEQRDSDISMMARNENLPIEEVIIKLIPTEEMKQKDRDIMSKISLFFNSEENVDFIINTVHEMLDANKNHIEYDLSNFNKRINEVKIYS
jgi:hypothetical protein